MKIVEGEQHLDLRLPGEREQSDVRGLRGQIERHRFRSRIGHKGAEAQSEEVGEEEDSAHVVFWKPTAAREKGSGESSGLVAQGDANRAVRLVVDAHAERSFESSEKFLKIVDAVAPTDVQVLRFGGR